MSREVIPETDPRYLAPWSAGMRAAAMAIVMRGRALAPLTVKEAVGIIDAERQALLVTLLKGFRPVRRPMPESLRHWAEAVEAMTEQEFRAAMLEYEHAYPGTLDKLRAWVRGEWPVRDVA